MKRPLLVIPVILAVFIGLLVWRVRMQDARSRAPSGGSATVEGIETVVSARIGGRITEVLTDEGKRVTKGQTVARIDCADPEAALALATARVHVAEAQVGVLEAQIGGAKDSVAVSRAQATAVEAQARVLAVAQAQAARDHARAAQLSDSGAVPAIELERAALRLQSLEDEIARASATTTAAKLGTRVTSSNVQVAQANLEVARAGVKTALADQRRAELAVADCTIVAPADGVVTGRLVEPGAVVGPGSRLLVTIALDRAKITFYIPNAELARARVGAPATVRVDAYPGREFHGAVSRVAEEAEFTPRNVQTREDRDRLVYAVEVLVENADGALRAGMPAEVSLDGTAR